MKVYLDYDQEELDRQYAPSSMIPDLGHYIRLYEARSAVARAKVGGQFGISYGNSPDELLDIYLPAAETAGAAPVQVFIHGGNWQQLSKNEAGMSAPDFAARGAAFVAVNYTLAPHAPMDEIVRQNRAAIAWIYRNIADHGCDPERIFISGHSAGGHLAAMLLCTDWEGEFDVPGDVIKGACAVSGIYDLEPVSRSYVNEALGLEGAAAARNSPIRQIPDRSPPLILAVGEYEPDEFKRQMADFAEAWRGRRLFCKVIEMAGFNHFDVIFELGNADSPLGQAVLAQMDLLDEL